MNQNTLEGCENAISEFQRILGWRDADEKIAMCKNEIKMIGEIEAEKREVAKRKIIMKIFVLICIVFFTVLISVIVPGIRYCNDTTIKNKDYDNAVSLMNSEKYNEAIAAFEALDGYKDSAE